MLNHLEIEIYCARYQVDRRSRDHRDLKSQAFFIDQLNLSFMSASPWWSIILGCLQTLPVSHDRAEQNQAKPEIIAYPSPQCSLCYFIIFEMKIDMKIDMKMWTIDFQHNWYVRIWNAWDVIERIRARLGSATQIELKILKRRQCKLVGRAAIHKGAYSRI